MTLENYQVVPLSEEDWERLAELRLASLRDSAQWLSGELRDEELRQEAQWREVARESLWSAIVFNSEDVGVMAVSPAEPIRNADTWLHSCWIAPAHRGKNLTSLMINRLDEICVAHGWTTQGLGVWPENERAIRSYLRLGFVIGGEARPSRRRPTQMYVPMFRTLR
jgi:RimJ/RimL family protein N-acetyltransferase